MSNINFDLKSILKSLKLNESNISMILGAIVIIVAGVLVVNYFKNKNTGEILPLASNETAVPSSGKTYTVVKGDTLWKISEIAYGSGFAWKDISAKNNLRNPDKIEVGQRLSIPEVSIQKTVKVAPNLISGPTYTVVKGDSLWNISLRAYADGYQWVKIARENKIMNPNLIYPGNVLTLPRQVL